MKRVHIRRSDKNDTSETQTENADKRIKEVAGSQSSDEQDQDSNEDDGLDGKIKQENIEQSPEETGFEPEQNKSCGTINLDIDQG